MVGPYPSEKYEKYSWEYYSQNIWKKHMFQTTNQIVDTDTQWNTKDIEHENIPPKHFHYIIHQMLPFLFSV